MPYRSLALALAILVGCSKTATEPTAYTVLVQPVVGPISGPDLWRATDSTAPASWSAPTQGWDTVSGTWCIHIPLTESVVALTDSQPGGSPALAQSWVGYLRLSTGAPSWIASVSGGKVAFAPGPSC